MDLHNVEYWKLIESIKSALKPASNSSYLKHAGATGEAPYKTFLKDLLKKKSKKCLFWTNLLMTDWES
jgi:hypothetical protein